MAVSQNGYRACDPSLIGKYTIPVTGGITINLRKGDVSVVLLDLLSWYHREIEPLHQDDTGGYNCRSIEGSAVKSNHGSGTAADVRWKKHVRGKKGTFTAAQKAKIHAKLREYAGVIRWGEDYTTALIDGMHFEINAGPAAVKIQADRIRRRNAEGEQVAVKDDVLAAMTEWWADAYKAADGKASGSSDEDRASRNKRDYVRKVAGGPVDQGAILAAITAMDTVDEGLLAEALIPGIAAAIRADLPDGVGTLAEVEQAVRNVLIQGVGE